MPRDTRETRPHSANEINSSVGPASVERFSEHAEIPQAPHIEGDVNDAAVNEDTSEQAPPFTRERERAPVRSPPDGLLGREVHDGGTGESHSQKHCDIDAKDYLGEADGGLAATDPRRGHDRSEE